MRTGATWLLAAAALALSVATGAADPAAPAPGASIIQPPSLRTPRPAAPPETPAAPAPPTVVTPAAPGAAPPAMLPPATDLPAPVPAPVPEGPTVPTARLSFAVLGGCRPGAAAGCSPVLQRLATELGESPVEMVLGTGDYVEGSSNQATLRNQYQWFFYALQPLQNQRTIPLALAPGAHEIGGSSLSGNLFTEYTGGLYYSFDRGAAHFIVLDTEVPGQEQRIMGDQWWWLVRDLYQALAAKYLFVVLNRPLFPVAAGRGESLDRYPPYRDALHKLFTDYRVSAVFAGSEALYNCETRDGVKYFITGAAGGVLDQTYPAGSFHHYLYVTCDDQGYLVQVKAVGG